jgi:hypothetical protein
LTSCPSKQTRYRTKTLGQSPASLLDSARFKGIRISRQSFSKAQVRKIGYIYQVSQEEPAKTCRQRLFPTKSVGPLLREWADLSKAAGRIGSAEDTVE